MRSRRPSQILTNDDGAFAILYAVLVLVLIGVVSLVIDLGSARMDRRENRSAADSAAIAGAAQLGLGGINPVSGCRAAMRYAEATLDVTTPGSDNCTTTFGSATCSATSTYTAQETVLGRDIYVTWPVPDTSILLTKPDMEQWGQNITQPASATSDGGPCIRLGVTIRQHRSMPFSFTSGTTTESRSVAVAAPDYSNQQVPAPLVVLDQHTCNALIVGGTGGVLVNHSLDGKFAGVVAIDSDGTGGEDNCNGGQTTMGAPSAANHLWALDGMDGTTRVPAEIRSYALAVGNTSTAYDTSDTAGCTNQLSTAPWLAMGSAAPHLCPVPQAFTRVTSLPWVNRYDCTGGCFEPDPSKPLPEPRDYVDQWVRFATGSAPASFPNQINGSGCNITANRTFTGDSFVNCPTLRIRASVSFNGRVVANGNISVTQSGCVLFSDTVVGDCSLPTLPVSSADGGNVYIAGDLSLSNSGSLVDRQAFIYVGGQLSATTTGTVDWVAPYGTALTPIAGTCVPATSNGTAPTPTCFESLGLWANTYEPKTSPDTLLGGSNLQVDGTLYMPNAYFKFGGATANLQTRAQFVSRRLEVHGGGDLTMTPDGSRNTKIPNNIGELIR